MGWVGAGSVLSDALGNPPMAELRSSIQRNSALGARTLVRTGPPYHAVCGQDRAARPRERSPGACVVADSSQADPRHMPATA